MRLLALVTLAVFSIATAARGQSLVGSWAGEMSLPSGDIQFVFHLSPEADGYAATMDVPAQEAYGVPARVTVDGDSVRFDLGMAVYSGVWNGDSMDGVFLQGSARVPLVLVRVSAEAVAGPNRPQTPVGPFPYQMEDVEVASVDGIRLGATVTIPAGDGPFPGAVLVSGSGAQDRDSNLIGHKIFAVWADHLARAGIASIRYDERGVGTSTGSFSGATTEDFARDARAALGALLSRGDVSSVGVVGHSEGGLVAPMVAGMTGDAAFVVLLAGSSVPAARVLPDQSEAISVASGADPAVIGAFARGYAEAFQVLLASDATDDATRMAMAQAYVDAGADLSPEDLAATGLTPDGAAEHARSLAALVDGDPWMAFFARYDPAPALRALTVPALAVFGGLDLQVTPRLNLAPMRDALDASASPNHSVVTFASLNHLLQPTATGNPSEYGAIETTVSTEVLDLVATWIAGATR